MSRIRDFVLKYLNVWLALIVGVVLGMCLFSLLLQAPKGLENWLSAVGTILAVVVSLYLANRPQKRGKLDINNVAATLHKHIDMSGSTYGYKLVISFDCRNIGGSDVLIRDIDARFVNKQLKMFSLNEILDDSLIKVGEIKYLQPAISSNSLGLLGNDFENNFDEKYADESMPSVIVLTLVEGTEIEIPINTLSIKEHRQGLFQNS